MVLLLGENKNAGVSEWFAVEYSILSLPVLFHESEIHLQIKNTEMIK